jgi:hypothetical protein
VPQCLSKAAFCLVVSAVLHVQDAGLVEDGDFLTCITASESLERSFSSLPIALLLTGSSS